MKINDKVNLKKYKIADTYFYELELSYPYLYSNTEVTDDKLYIRLKESTAIKLAASINKLSKPKKQRSKK